jgi:hypothetical protein
MRKEVVYKKKEEQEKQEEMKARIILYTKKIYNITIRVDFTVV